MHFHIFYKIREKLVKELGHRSDLPIQSFAKPKLFRPYKKTGKSEEIPSSDTTLWLHPNKGLIFFFVALRISIEIFWIPG